MKKQDKQADNQSTIYVQRPATINLDVLLKNNPPQFSYRRDGFLYLFDLYIDHFSWRESKEILNDESFVPLHSQNLKFILHNYQFYINYLVEAGIWERDDHYLVDEYAKSYRFVGSYNTAYVSDEITDPKLISKLRRKQTQDNQLIDEKYPGLLAWFSGLEIDYEGAMQFIDTHLQSAIQGKKRLTKKAKKKLDKKRSSYTRSVMKVANKDFSFKLDNRSGRLFSVLTNMKKELRAYLTYQGKKLVCVDLSNSQPLFSLLLLHKNFYDNGDNSLISLGVLSTYIQTQMHKKSTMLTDDINRMTKYQYNNLSRSPIIIYDGIPISNIDEAVFVPKCGQQGDYEGQAFNNLHDAALYSYNVRHGQLYESVKQQMNSDKPDKEIKKGILSMLFADSTDKRVYFKKYKTPFKQLYWNVYRLFWIIKNNDHSLLAYLLQSIEAEVFLNRICKRVRNEYPSIPLFTIHDSVATTEENEAYLTKVIKEEITKAVGIEPHLKREDWLVDKE